MEQGQGTRPGAWDWAFSAAAVLTLVLLANLGRATTFWLDDWMIIGSPLREGWTLDALMRPHNDHWLLTLMLVWKPLLDTVGLHSHLPYLLPTLVAHIGAAAAVYILVRRQTGPFIAFAVGLLFLLLGTAGEVFFFAVAFNLVAATALGAWALVVALPADPARPLGGRRSLVLASLLLAAVASGGPGLFYLPVVVVIALLVPGRRRELWVVMPAALAFLAWRAAYAGASGLGTLTDLESLRALGDYIRTGVAHAAGAVSGLEDQVGLIIAVVLVGGTAWHLLGRRPLLLGAVAGVTGMLAAYAVTGLARAQMGVEQATAARYVYTAAPFFLLAVSAWLGTLSPIEPRRPRAALTVAAFFAIALAANVVQLRWWQQFFVERAEETRAAITVVLGSGASPAVPTPPVGPPSEGSAEPSIEGLPGANGLPDADRLRELIERYGNPLTDPFA